MDFAYILTELDRELNRLGQLRAIVAGLERIPPVVEAKVGAPVTVSAPELPKPVRHRGRSPRLASRRALKQMISRPEPRALAATIPTGPVVIPAAVVREREMQKAFPPAAPAELAPEALLKELTARWASNGAGTGAS